MNIRFGSFELETESGELKKNGHRIRLQDQPTRLLILLASRPGVLVTRSEIQKSLWGDRFVEFEHAINTAVRKIREALEDATDKPSIIETVPRKGYRFIASVEVQENEAARQPADVPATPPVQARPESALGGIAAPIFLFIQAGYLAMYCTLLYFVEGLEGSFNALGFVHSRYGTPFIVVAAMCGIAVRLYLFSSVALKHPAAAGKFRQLFPVLLVLDGIWAASPLLAVRTVGYGIALAGVAGFAYLPFSQRTLMSAIEHHRAGG